MKQPGDRLAGTDDLYRAIAEEAPDALLAVDEDGVIKIVNRQAEVLFGYDRAEMIGTGLERLVPQRMRAAHMTHRGSYAKDPHVRPLNARMNLVALRKDGTEIPVDIALSSVETPDGVLVTAAVRDISARIEAEREGRRMQAELYQARIQQAERLETVGQLAGGIAHDFNNLLAVILNYAEFLHEELPEGQMRSDVAEIQGAANRAADLTRQLLIFARREVAKPELLDVNQVVSGVEKLLRRTLGENVEFVTKLTPSLPAVLIDPGQLEQVFMNLAVNARDAMPSGGRLVVETSDVELDDLYVETHPGVSPGRYVRLSVSDTGVGMPPEVVARAFEPFFTTKPAGSGTGLGLSTVYGIVTRAGGSVRIYSEPAHGTLVAIHLPAQRGGAHELEHAPAPALAEGRGETILVVEDEAPLLLSTVRLLGDHGYKVFAHSDPKDAISFLEREGTRLDLLLTDVVMPGVSGAELARRARSKRPDVRVIYMSGYSNEVVSHQGEVVADGALLQKPFTRADLLKTIRDQLDAGRRGG